MRPFVCRRYIDGEETELVGCSVFVCFGVVLVESPLPDVAVEVVDAEWIGFLRADLVSAALRQIGEIGIGRILLEPGIFAEVFGIGAERVRLIAFAGTSGVFPLGF